jgi:hypothetical protein
MAQLSVPIANRILNQLGTGEKRILSLVVGVRREMNATECVKGDLTEQVKSALNKLIAADTVVDADGMYSLKNSK